jgi:hypothetical protein
MRFDGAGRMFSTSAFLLVIQCCILFLLFSASVNAAHTSVSGDLAVPIEDPGVVERGSALYAEKCSACHGGEGRGGRAPCLTCGKFSRSGNTNRGIYGTIAVGLPMTKMGAFATTVSSEDILSLVTYLRWKENERIESGEISPPNAEGDKPLEFPGTENSY